MKPSGTVAPIALPQPSRRRVAARRIPRLVKHVVLIAAAVLAFYPIWFMLTTAFKGQHDYLTNPYSFPWPLTVSNFSDAVHGGEFFTWFKNSIILTVGAVVVSTAAAALAAFAIARMRF